MLDKEDISTAKEIAKVLRESKVDELVVAGNLITVLLAEREQQRTWVRLNDEDRRLIRKWTTYNQFMTAGEYAEAVQIATEEKLKGKNT